jgi:hypothetical protein
LQFTAASDFGVVWPRDAKGRVSTTDVGKRVWVAAAGEGTALADAIAQDQKWRWQYPEHLVQLAEQACRTPEAALEVATRGLDALYSEFQFVKPDGTRVPLAEMVDSGPQV